jgi:hypothetical protein
MLELKEEEKKIKNGRQPYGLLQQSTGTWEACEFGPIFVFFIYIKGGRLFKHATLAPHTDVFQPIHIKP